MVATFWPTLDFGLLWWDDRAHLFVDGQPVDPWSPWTGPKNAMYMPMTFSTWALAWRLGEGDPGWLHGMNLAGHLLVGLLAFRLLRRSLAAPAWAAAVGVTWLWLHPVAVEPVAWITSWKDVLSTVLALAAVLAATPTAPRPPGPGRLAAAGALALLAALSKATAPAFVVAALGLVAVLRGRPRDLLRSLPVVVLAALPPVVVTALSQQEVAPLAPVAWLDRPRIVLDTLGFAGAKLLAPWPVLASYGRTPEAVLVTPLTTYGVGALAALNGAALAWSRGGRLLPAVLLAATVALLPTSGLLPFGGQTNSTVSDRYLYGPLVLSAWAVTAGAAGLRRRVGSAALPLLGVPLAVLAALASLQVPRWQSDAALWRHTLQHAPDRVIAWVNLGAAHQRAGDLDAARTAYVRALALDPEAGHAATNLGVMAAEAGDLDAAAAWFQRAVDADPRIMTAWAHLVRAHHEAGRPAQALAAARAWQARWPGNPHARDALARLTAEPAE